MAGSSLQLKRCVPTLYATLGMSSLPLSVCDVASANAPHLGRRTTQLGRLQFRSGFVGAEKMKKTRGDHWQQVYSPAKGET
ncbi:hypothetical protein M514_06020, partial [Trichuris suis]